jgi:hypothetical protein
MRAATEPQAAARGEPATTWRSHAFGIVISGAFAAPGLPPCDLEPDSSLPRTQVDLVPAAEVDARWGDGAAERLLEERFDDDPLPARTIDYARGRGDRLYARHFGLAHVSDDGSSVACAPPELEPWSWQRFLVGRILPWAALLRGLEVFHASAFAFDGLAYGLVGATGAGKTSLAMRLFAGGAAFVTDDVLAVDVRDGVVRAHPGAAIASVRDEERAALGEQSLASLGRILGHSGKTYVETARVAGALPLGGLYVLDRSSGARDAIERIDNPPPSLLIGSTFVESVQTAGRLLNQLDVCAAIAHSVPVFRVGISAGVGAGELAGRLAEHARGAAP